MTPPGGGALAEDRSSDANNRPPAITQEARVKKLLSALVVILALVLLAPGLAAQEASLYGGIARSEGHAGSIWSTSFVVVNTGDEVGSVAVSLLPSGPTKDFLVFPHRPLVVGDLVAEMEAPDGAYAARVSASGGASFYLSTSTPSPAGGHVAAQLPALVPGARVIPLVSSRAVRAAFYVAAEPGAAWRVVFVGDEGAAEEKHEAFSVGGLTRIVPPSWATAAAFTSASDGSPGPGGAGGVAFPASAAYVTFADSVTSAPEIVQ